MRFLAAFLMCCSTAFAEPPKAVITGPVDGVPGDIIELSAEESTASHYLFAVIPDRHADGKPTYKVSKDQTTCQITSRPGTYRVLLVVSNDDGPAIAWHTVKIVDVSNPTQPPPQNPPPTDPVKPPPVTPVPTLSDWVMATAKQKVQYTRATTGKQFADGYRLWAAGGVVAKDVTEFAKAQDALNKARLATLDASTKAEWDAFFKDLAIRLSGMNLATVADAQRAWLEIADGLERAGK